MKQRTVHIALPCTGDDEWQAVREPIFNGWLTQGPRVAEFERAFAERHRVPHALAASSCTTGLHMILCALGIGPGDEVIVPSFTWIATANVVRHCGATPVFTDIDRATFTIDPDDAARRVTPRTRALIAVHLFGLCADIGALRAALPSNVQIVEDAACAAGADYKGVPAGGLGTAAAFSFHPRKSITTGEGGMVTTRDAQLAATIEKLRNHGAEISEEQRHDGPRPYLLPAFNLLGFNYRMTDVQGAIGLAQLGKLDAFIRERRHRAEWYRERLSDIPWLRTPIVPDGYGHAWQSYVTYIDAEKAPLPRDEIMDRMSGKGIATRPGTHAVHTLGLYREKYGLRPDDYPASRDCDRQTMALPMHNRMTDEDYEYVVVVLKGISPRR